MQRVIVKTALITAGVVLSLAALLFGVFALFFPSTLANVFFEAGNNDVALTFEKRAYELDPSDDNLIKVINRAIAAEEQSDIVLYGTIFTDKVYNGQLQSELRYYYLVAGTCCTVKYENDGLADEAIAFAFKHSAGYGEFNPVEMLVIHGIEKNDVQLLTKILNELNEYKQENGSDLSAESSARLDKNINNLTAYLQR